MNILIIDDDKDILNYLHAKLEYNGYKVFRTEAGEEALKILENENIDMVLTDVMLPGISGLDILSIITSRYQNIPVIVMTSYSSIETAVTAIKKGAYDYIPKPFYDEAILFRLAQLRKFKEREQENIQLRSQLRSQYHFENIIGQSKTMEAVFEKIETVADTNANVVIQGASGTGKEVIARALHYNSSRRNKPFIKVSCGIFNQEILESELFGHEKGSFTGAMRQKVGRFEMAHGGSIFLDDIDDIPLSAQVKILRVLQEREFERVGGEKTIKTDVRVIVATKKDLKAMADEGKFREDLYFRLNVVQIVLPLLSERREDIPLLISYFIKKYDRTGKINPNKISHKILEFAHQYPWPGNVRELEHAIEHAVIFCQGPELDLCHFPPEMFQYYPIEKDVSMNFVPSETVDFREMENKLAKKLLQWAWDHTQGHQKQMAKLLNLPVATLRDKLIKFNFISNNETKIKKLKSVKKEKHSEEIYQQ